MTRIAANTRRLRPEPAEPPESPEPPSDEIVLSPMDRALTRRVVTPARAAAVLGFIALAAVTAYAYQRFGAQRTLAVGAERVTISTVGDAVFREYIPVTGNFVPRTTVYLDAVEGGQVTAVHAEAGEVVAAGQPLVSLKNTNLQLEVIGREAQLTEQLNDLSGTALAFEQNRLRHRRELIEIDWQIARLERELARRRLLVATGGATQSELEELEAELAFRNELRAAVEEARHIDEQSQAAQVDTLREAVEAMRRNLDIARENLDKLMITAPIDGQIGRLEANVGASMAPGERIGQIDEQGAFKVSAFVDEFYLTRVRIGQTASVDIGGMTHVLEVVKVYPDVQNRQFEIELEFPDESPGAIRRGQTVRMRLEIGRPADTLVLANGAFYEDTGGGWAFVLDESGRYAERRSVRLGRRNPDGIEVLDGLAAGERVITSSYGRFLDADRVELRGGTG